MSKVTVPAICLLLSYAVLRTIRNFWKASRDIRDHTGFRVLINNKSILGFLLQRPRTGIVVGSCWTWTEKYEPFRQFGVDIISAVSAFPSAEASIWIADASAAKEIVTNRSCFIKPSHNYTFLNVFGDNVVASEGENWKRHRKVCAPAFGEANNVIVWEETIGIMQDLFESVWGKRNEIHVKHMVEITHSIAVYVIGRAGFGRQVGWNDTQTVPSGHKVTFKQALRTISESLFFRALLPSWLYTHFPWGRIAHVRSSFVDFEEYMTEMITARQSFDEIAPHDIFSMLLEAMDNEKDSSLKLNQRELLGNIFIILFAGHETTSHTMALAFGLLAVYQDEQDLLYQELKKVLSDRETLAYTDVHKLVRCAAIINETLRLYPPAPAIPKVCIEDTLLNTTNSSGQPINVAIPRGINVIVNIPALHYNPRYWPEPHEFRPSRFLEEWNRDAFVPFSGGPRSCLGRRFAELELLAVLSTTILRYKVDLPLEQTERFPNETLRERRERILSCEFLLTMTPMHVPLVFKKRQESQV